MAQPQLDGLCVHLWPHCTGRGTALGAGTDVGRVVLVGSEPAGAASAPAPLYPSLTDVRTAGFTASLVCAEHHRELAWGHGARPEVTGEFARRAREELRVRVAPELAARSAARTEARRERAAAGAPLGQLRDWLLDREGARCPPHRAYVSRWSDSASLCDAGSPV